MARKRDTTDPNASEAMSGNSPRTDPNTDSDVNELLKRLLTEAARNGVSVEGGWTVRNGPDLPDWDIHITQVTKPDDEVASDSA